VPGATPSQLVLALGEDSKAYLLNRNNLGGIAQPLASANLPTTVRGQSAATYHTCLETYFAFHTENNAVATYRVTATNPPTIVKAWSMSQPGLGSAWVTSTDGTNNVIVWVAGVEGDQRLHAYNADTGAMTYADIAFRFADGVSDDSNDSDPNDDHLHCFNSRWWYPIFSLRTAALPVRLAS
jgi:hypothetical protein